MAEPETITASEVAKKLGLVLKRKGNVEYTPCPFGCDDSEKDPHCQVGGNKLSLVHCYKCQTSTNALGLVKAVLHCDDRAAFQWVRGEGFLPREHSGTTKPFTDPLRDLAARRGWTVEALHALGCEARDGRVVFPMRDAEGKMTGKKERRGDGQLIGDRKSHTTSGSRNGLFYPTPFPQDGPVLVCEGEPDTAAALSAGHEAVVGTAGCNPGEIGRNALPRLLHGRECILAPHPDKEGRKWLGQVGRLLANGQGHVRFVPADTGDLDDRLRGQSDRPAFLQKVIAEAVPWKDEIGTETESKNDRSSQKSQSDRLVAIISKYEVSLFHAMGDREDAFVSIPVDNHAETYRVRSTGFRRWLAHRHFERYGQSPNSQALAAALEVIEGKALYEGVGRLVAVRLASHNGCIYLDLGDEHWQAVEISTTGWRIIQECPVCFIRPRGHRALPTPVKGGHMDELRRFVNVADDDQWILLRAALLGCLRPAGPYLVLVVVGEQGSCKSTLCRIFRDLIDPNVAALRAEPREVRDLMIAAQNSWLIVFDNISHIQPWLSDALCRLATGGGFATRELYTDGEEVIFDSVRPILLNGIEEFVTRPDLMDRAIALQLSPISEENRRPECDLLREWREALPRILGALLDAASLALRDIDSVSLSRAPRMADFAKWVVAGAPALGFTGDEFLAAYGSTRRAAADLAIETSPVGPMLVRFMTMRDRWEGTSTELLGELNAGDCTDERMRQQRDWPRSARKLSGELRRLCPSLRAKGLSVSFRARTNAKRLILIESNEGGTPSRPSSSSPRPSAAGAGGWNRDGSVTGRGEGRADRHGQKGSFGRAGAEGDGRDDVTPVFSSSPDSYERDERAAIMEFDGGMSRTKAEKESGHVR
jgi:hypothetical protein